MVMRIAHSSGLNSFSSICYCIFTLGIHAYSCYTAISRYKEAKRRDWPGGSAGHSSGPPIETPMMLGLTILSLVLMPLFCFTCILKVGNLANDGVKLGRDHALGCVSDTTKDCSTKSRGFRRLWKNACPVSQTVHVIAAFLLLLPETFLTAAEVKFGYKSSDVAWASDIDFLFAPERAFLSEIRSSVNAALYTNATHVILPTPRIPVDGWHQHIIVSVAFVNFCFALVCFLVRYASVFWYTNKAFTVVFALQLFAMVLNSIFSFNSFSVLYCVCYNQSLYPNVTLSLRCAVDLVLYLLGSTILLLSTMTIFLYGTHYFHEKFKVISRHHNPESYIKETVLSDTGGKCQGYVPHSYAMGSLVLFAICKGPLLYDLVLLLRVTDDKMILTGIVCEVCYMVLWLALWSGLTLKQQWQFRILDYIAFRPTPVSNSGLSDDGSLKSSYQAYRGDCSIPGDSLTRQKRLSGRDQQLPQGFIEPPINPTGPGGDERYSSDLGTDESDNLTSAAEMAAGIEEKFRPDRNFNPRCSRKSRHGGQRNVTFEEEKDSAAEFSEAPIDHHTQVESMNRPSSRGVPSRPDETLSNINVTADIHDQNSACYGTASIQDAIMRRPVPSTLDAGQLSRDYRNSLRSKGDENFNNDDIEDDIPVSLEPLPTLMSSFRDKVRESSLATTTFKEREKNMLQKFDRYMDHVPPPLVEQVPENDKEKRRCVAISDEDIVDISSIHPSVVEKSREENREMTGSFHRSSGPDGNVGFENQASSKPKITALSNARNSRGRSLENETDRLTSHSNPSFRNSTSLPHPTNSLSSDEGHRSSYTSTTLESSDISLPPAMEDFQQVGRYKDGQRPSRNPNTPQPHYNQFGAYKNMVGKNLRKHGNSGLISQPSRIAKKVGACVTRRDSAYFSFPSSQETSSNESEYDNAMCSQV